MEFISTFSLERDAKKLHPPNTCKSLLKFGSKRANSGTLEMGQIHPY